MKRWLFVFFVLAFILPVVIFAYPTIDPQAKIHEKIGDRDIQVPVDAPGMVSVSSELDDIVGDTVIVGTTYWDTQHNGQVGRMVGFSPNGDGANGTAFVVWMKLDDAATSSQRHIRFARVEMEEDGSMTVHASTNTVDGEPRAGYTTLSFDPETGTGFPTFHTAFGTPEARSRIAAESVIVPGFFSTFRQSILDDRSQVWPHSVWGSDGYAHMVTHENRSGNTDAMRITYMRWLYDPVDGVFDATTPDDLPLVITTDGMNISGDVATSADGQRVAITQTVSREFTMNEVYSDGGTQFNNDIYLWESTDGGATWDFDSPFNVTNFIGPDETLLPDSIAANKDSLRAYTDGSVIYDSEDNLHVAFTTPEYFPMWDAAYVFSHIYHWDRVSGVYTQIADGAQPDSLIGQAEAWGRVVDRPSLYSDPDTGILWCVFRKVSSYPDTFDVVDNDGEKANSDIWISASPPGDYNGKLWTKGVNLTRTIWRGPDSPVAGESRSEMDPSISLYNDGDYLYITYVQDLDPGSSISSPVEGVMTNNPFVLHRVSKMALLEAFEEQAEWVRNYPMHVDSSGFWVDDQDYGWDEAGGFFREIQSVDREQRLLPGQVELDEAYPNPFNPSTRIIFRLERTAQVKLTVYDLLGREVATLLNRPMQRGEHHVTFLADDLASGVYFVHMQANNVMLTRKVILMK